MEGTDKTTAANAELKGFKDLVIETWEEYKSRGLTIIGVMLTAGVIMLVLFMLFGLAMALFMGRMGNGMARMQQGELNWPVVLIFGFFFLVAMLSALWSQSATIAASVDDRLGVWDALRIGRRRLWDMGWILLLVSSIVMAGFFLFIVPGILLSVSLMFALYPLYDEGLQGMDAVLASHYAVKGRWWNTFGKLLLISLISFVLNMIPLIGPVLYVLFTPFLFLFMVALYRNLQETALVSVRPAGSGRWWLMAGVGMILPLLGLIGAVVTLGPQLPSILQRLQLEYRQSVHIESAGPAGVHRSSLQKHTPAVAGPASRIGNQGIWHDPVGDVVDFGVGRWLDIETVSVKAAADVLSFDVQLHYPLAASFNAASTTAQSLYTMATIYLDVDVNRNTGGVAGKNGARSGYDYGLKITLEAPRNEPRRGRVHVSLFHVENGGRKFFGPLADEQVRVLKNHVRITIPYSAIGVRAGEKIRLSFMESFQKQGGGLSKDKLIDL